jgi:hypothetical protein
MQTLELEKDVIVGLLLGSKEHRLKLLSNDKVLESLDIDFFRFMIAPTGDTKEGSFWDEKDYSLYDVIEILQVLAYNRHKTKDSDRTADFVFDKLFEFICDYENW